jgi:hypothetical protein
MRVLLSVALAAVLVTAAHGWTYLEVVATAPAELVRVIEGAR